MLSLVIFSILLSVHLTNAFTSMPRRSLSSSRRFLFGTPEQPKDGGTSPAKKDGGGMFGGMGNLMDSMKKAQEIAKQAESMNKELAGQIIVGNDASGKVTATFNGLGQPIGIKIGEELMGKSAEEISLASTEAMIDAYTKATNMMMSKMQNLYAGAGVPAPP